MSNPARIPGPSRHRAGARRLAVMGAALALGAGLAVPSAVSALQPAYPACSATTPAGTQPCTYTGDLRFEMDGNTTVDTTGGTDWSTPGLGATSFSDGSGPGDDGFVQGSKWDDQSTWTCSESHTSSPKDDLLGGAMLIREANVGTVAAPDMHQVFLFDFTRLSAGGDTFVDFEFSRSASNLTANPPGCNAEVPRRATGDMTITLSFTGGGGVAGIEANRWDCSVTPCVSHGLSLGVQGTDWMVAVSSPSTFGEGGIDLNLTGIGPLGCNAFARTWMDTRSAGSGSPSEVKDLVAPAAFSAPGCPPAASPSPSPSPGSSPSASPSPSPGASPSPSPSPHGHASPTPGATPTQQVLGASIGGSQPNTGQAAALWMGVIGFLALLAGAVMVLHGFRPRRSEPS